MLIAKIYHVEGLCFMQRIILNQRHLIVILGFNHSATMKMVLIHALFVAHLITFQNYESLKEEVVEK